MGFGDKRSEKLEMRSEKLELIRIVSYYIIIKDVNEYSGESI